MTRPIRRFLHRWWWAFLAASALLAGGLGFAGFREHFAALGQPKSGWDVLYLTLQLFTLSSGAVQGPVPAPLQVARFLAPAVAAYTLGKALVVIFGEHVQGLRLRMLRGHVIVCGLGRKGTRLVEQLLNRRERVVVLDPAAGPDELRHCRERGAIVLQGAANDRWALRQAQVARAKLLLSVAGDDGANVEAAVLAHDLNRGRKAARPLQCVIHVSEPQLQKVLRRHGIYGDRHDPFELEFFNAYELAARVMLRELAERSPQNGPPHLLVVGLGHLGEALVWRAARDWQIDKSPSGRGDWLPPVVDQAPSGHTMEGAGPRFRTDSELGDGRTLRITVADCEAVPRQQRVYLRHPGLKVMPDVRIDFACVDIYSPEFARGKFLPEGAGPVTAAYVCLDGDAAAMYAALALRNPGCLPPDVPVVVRMTEEAGMAALLGAGTDGEPAIPGLRAVGLLDIACTLDLVLGGGREILAHAVHQGYVAQERAKGATPEDNPSMVPWEQLSEHLKESNRRQADDIEAKLDLVGCELAPQPDGEVRLLEFTPEEVERLARREHDRWMAERLEAGWRFAAGPKDVERRTSPHLVGWDDLTEESRGKKGDAALFLTRLRSVATLASCHDAPVSPLEVWCTTCSTARWRGWRCSRRTRTTRPSNASWRRRWKSTPPGS